MAFRFKQFTVEDDRSTMRTGTDAVLLGAWAKPEKADSILDIGTGCGVISLMLAQRSHAQITAIDPDEGSVRQAESNFTNSPWAENLVAIHSSLQDYTASCRNKSDLIITNPPFFTDSLKSPDPVKNMARHDIHLSRRELLDCVLRLLGDNGQFLLILPGKESKIFSVMAEESGLFPQRTLEIRPKQGKQVNRILTAYGFEASPLIAPEELVIRDQDGRFTKDYIDFTGDYYFSLR
ncbi:MAG: methyltransferase [Bacteroidetes bacterium]|nr:methyltransferase [Bacteroidota bacterium]